ncbi:Ras-related small GTP-binding family protein [Hibiscus syriacus]|uniref:Ras-related small GTP-binding family protein n=1 Tax=Hibiscus syriacus TaxID=106335 RepID=A0A6A2XLV6_HIBSY|nr:Ras-related small GTP-binding family protein [Hibiscus syriacus]
MAKSIVSAVLEKLGSLLTIPDEIKQNVELALALEEEIGKLSVHFQDIISVLQDAESKQVKDGNVRNWLKKLKDAAYDVEDVLDEWKSAKLKPQLEKEEKEVGNFPLFKKIRRSISSLTFQTMLHYNIASKIKTINQQLDCIANEKDRYKFGLEKDVEESQRLVTASFIDEDEVYGRFEEITILVNMLVGESSSGGSSLDVISIIGMGGIGKTTLAQLVYNHNDVESHFDKRIWICVSDPFDEIRIAKEILEAFKGESPKLVGKDNILQEVRSHVLGKKILIVLDDVWTEDATKWEQLKNSLKYCSLGSRILVTTRKEKVAIIMGTMSSNVFLLNTLSQEECWSLLSHRAFCGRTRDESENLEDIGWKIAKKCQGLPLAASILGGLLLFKRTREQWQSILDSEVWDIEEAERDLFPPLALSYYELPLALKQCISYCAVFSKDTILSKDELIKLWMAQDYLKGVRGEEMEIVGEEYFDELKMRSFFEAFKWDELDSGIVKYKMHDLVHDFLQVLMETECLMIVSDGFEKLKVDSSCERVRHATLNRREATPTEPNIYHFKNLRSLLIDSSYHDTSSLSPYLPKLFDRLTRLRTLNLSNSLFGNSIEELPDEIGKLVHLRYLNLKNNRKLKELPESLCELCNLLTLNLKWCDSLKELPSGIGKIINLRHLENERTDLSLIAMPKGIGRLTNLQTLSVFVVTDNSNASTLGDLQMLKHLRGHLKISGLGAACDLAEAKKAEIRKKEGLRTLILDFATLKGLMSERLLRTNDGDLLEALEPPTCLEKLEIWCYRGRTIFPCWMMSLTKLSHVSLGSCLHLNSLPPLGKLPSLESLYIGEMRRVKEVGVEFLGVEREETSALPSSSESPSSSVIAFPNLKHLEFFDLKEWESWMPLTIREEEHISVMPQLRSLTIGSCPKLRELPCYILQNTSLRQLDISQSPILSGRCRKETGEDWLKISHIQSIIIDGLCTQVNSYSVEEFGVLQFQPIHRFRVVPIKVNRQQIVVMEGMHYCSSYIDPVSKLIVTLRVILLWVNPVV